RLRSVETGAMLSWADELPIMRCRTRTQDGAAAPGATARAAALGHRTRDKRPGHARSAGGGARDSSRSVAARAWAPRARRNTARAWRRNGHWPETQHGGCG